MVLSTNRSINNMVGRNCEIDWLVDREAAAVQIAPRRNSTQCCGPLLSCQLLFLDRWASTARPSSLLAAPRVGHKALQEPPESIQEY